MALRAGYYGVKKSVLRVIEGLSGAKIIKTIGNGLKLTSAGTLSADLDADTMEFKGGKIAAKLVESLKTYEYVGNGSDTLSLELDDPTVVIGIFEITSHDGYKGVILPFDLTQSTVLVLWFRAGSNPGSATHTVSASGNTITLSGDATQIANANGQKYIVLYK